MVNTGGPGSSEICQRRPGFEDAGVAVDVHVAQIGARLDELRGHVAVVETADHVGDHQAHRPADLGEVPQLGGAMAGQAQHRDDAGPQQRERRHRELSGVGQLQQHAVSRRDAPVGQRGGHPVGQRVEFGKRVATGGVDDGGLVRPLGGRIAQDGIQRAALPVAGLAVLRGAVVGKRYEPACEFALLALKSGAHDDVQTLRVDVFGQSYIG